MTSRIVRFGLVGAGGIAQAYLQAFANTDLAILVAVADVREDVAQAMAESAQCQSFKNYEDMIASVEIDAVVICTPPVSHPEICQAFLSRKIHVLCEKPLSIDLASAVEMHETAQAEGVLLTMASKFRFVEDMIQAKSILASGILGEILLLENAFTARIDMSKRWNTQPDISGGGVLIDNGTHSVDIMRYFLGPLVAVQAIEGKRTQSKAVEDTVQLFIRSAQGVLGSIDLSWSIHKELDYYLRIHGSQGTISVGWQGSKYRQTHSSDWVAFGQGYNKMKAFCAQIENFSKAILDQEPLLINSEDGIASVAVIEAAYRSMAQDQWETLPTLSSAQKLNETLPRQLVS